MSRRLRLVQVEVRPVFLVDDGDDLHPLDVQPFVVPATDWPNVLSIFAAATADLREKVEADEDEPPGE